MGSDLMYTKGDTYGGLFETKWDLNSIYDEGGDTFTSIKNHAYANKYSSSYLTFNFKQLTTTTTGRGKTTTSYESISASDGKEAIKHRVHTRFNINGTFLGTNTNPLWLRIESEELNEGGGDKQNTTVRQIFINVNADNTGQNYRPLVIFYDGPDRAQLDGDVDTGKNQTVKEKYPNLKVRDPLPVILNLNADFKGILFAPSSPVVILGNGHKMLGFVIAKEIVQLDTSSGTSVTRDGITFCVDSWGNLKTKALPATSRRRPTYAETPTGQTYDEYLTTYYSTFIDFKKKYFVDYEYVYLRSAFNLSLDSYYDSFKIPELERKIYLYLEKYRINAPSVDMFFTTVRSKWIT